MDRFADQVIFVTRRASNLVSIWDRIECKCYTYPI